MEIEEKRDTQSSDSSDPAVTPDVTTNTAELSTALATVRLEKPELSDPAAGTAVSASQFSSRAERRAVIMNALLIVTSFSSSSSSSSFLDSFCFERPRSSTANMFTTNISISFELLAQILMAFNRDESVSFSGYVSSPDRGPLGTAPLPVKRDNADESTFRKLLARQLQGLLGSSSSGNLIVPSWRKNMRGEFTLSLD
jgi:hypothetical protein